MRNTFWPYLVVIIVMGLLIVSVNEASDGCRSKGGVMVRAAWGLECVKLEVLE